MSRYEKKLKDKMDDEIKLAGLEALVHEELEKHLIDTLLKSLANFRGCAPGDRDVRGGEIWLRIRDSKPSDTGSRGHTDFINILMRSTLFRLTKEKRSSRPRDGCFKCGGVHFQRDWNAHKGTGKQGSGKGKQSKSWFKSEANGNSKENKGQSKGQSRGTKGATDSHKGKTWKTGLSSLEESKSETSWDTQETAQTCPSDTSWNDGWNCDEWSDDWSSFVWHEGWEQTHDTSASSFSLGGLDATATSSPRRFDWVKMNLDTEELQ